jgi:uncharacterized membrane protein YgdD (TMEM256/DUF423 family)
MKKWIGVVAALLAGTAVALGAFGAHALKESLQQAGRFDTYETAVRYQFYHALALFVLYLLQSHLPWRRLQWVTACFSLGVLLFCGSLYVICFTGVSAWGAVAPLGGTLFIAGWLLLAFYVWKN